jgi:putative ABC transport system permease protein
MIFTNLRYGLRLLRRNPAFSAAAITVMALGIGATTAVFTVVRAVLLQPLPYEAPDRLVVLRADAPGFVQEPALTMEEFRALSGRTDVFAQIGSINQSEANFTGVEVMEAVNAASVSDGFFDLLGIAPIAGRHLALGADGGKLVRGASISYELWQRRWRGDPGIVGRTIEINNLNMVIVGILPPGFRVYLGPGTTVAQQIDVWFPQLPVVDSPRYRGFPSIARLRPDLTITATQASLDAFITQLVAENASSYASGPLRLSIVPMADDVVKSVRPALMAFAGAVAFVLLVACANLTHLLMARVSERTGELTVRSAVGATKRHIVTQLTVESLLLGGFGTVAGLVVANWVLDGLMRFAPATLPRRDVIGIDGGAALFAVAVSLACTVVFGLVPAYRAADPDLASRLKHRRLGTRYAGVNRGILIGGQIAMSLILLVAAGLMARAFVSMRTVPLGFDPANVLTMRVNVQFQRFATPDLRRAFFTAAADEVRRLPGVTSVALGQPIPLSDVRFTQRFAVGQGETEHTASTLVALPGFFETLGISVLAGRAFTDADAARRDPLIMVDRRLAERMWPGQDPVGRLLWVGPAAAARANQVIGVVETLRLHSVRDEPPAQIWQAYGSRPAVSLGLAVRTSGDPRPLADPVRRTVERLQPGRPVSDVRLLREYVADATADTRFALLVLGAFAGLALILTAVGIYGVVAYATARRSHEIAVRLALGGDARRVVALVMRETVAWTLAGAAVGLAGAAILTRYLESLLFEVTAADPLTFVGVGAFVIAVALAATALPAARAVRLDPMRLLKAD